MKRLSQNRTALALCAVIILIIALSFLVPSGREFVSDKQESTTQHSLRSESYQSFLKALRCHSFEKNDYSAINYDCQIGVWISYIDLAKMLDGADEQSFRESISTAYKNVLSLGANTVYVHVRAFSDAYYPSVMYPYTNAFGDAQPFDALKIMIDEAHKLGLSFHAWINPLRCGTQNALEQCGESYGIKRFYSQYLGEYVNATQDSPYLWLNPAYDEVREYISDGASEIVSRYDVDGIHIDDYFYPTTSEDFDRTSFEKSGADDLYSWRRMNITRLVMSINIKIKSVNPTVMFEISPQGNITNNYQQQFADVESWCSSRLICDAVIPQVYYGYNSSCPYAKTIEKWSEMTQNSGVKLVVGLGVYKITEESEFINTDGIIARQIADAKKLSTFGGIALYNYSTLFEYSEDSSQKVQLETEGIKRELS